MGLDSIIAFELDYQIETDFGISIPVVKFLEGITIAQLATYIMDQSPAFVTATSAAIEAAAPHRHFPQQEGRISPLNHNTAEQLLKKVDQLSEKELDLLLTDLLPQE